MVCIFSFLFKKNGFRKNLDTKKRNQSVQTKKMNRYHNKLQVKIWLPFYWTEFSNINLMILLSLTSDSSIVSWLINFVSVLLKLFEIWEYYLTWSRHQGIRWDQSSTQQNAHTLRRNRKPLWELYSILEIIQQLWLTSAKVAYATHSIWLVQVGIKF